MNKKQQYDTIQEELVQERIKAHGGPCPMCMRPEQEIKESPCIYMWTDRCDSSCDFNCHH